MSDYVLTSSGLKKTKHFFNPDNQPTQIKEFFKKYNKGDEWRKMSVEDKLELTVKALVEIIFQH